MPFKFGIIQESLTTAIMSALEQFVSVDSIMFLETCSIMENFATALKRASEDLGLLVAGATGWSSSHHAARTLFEKSRSYWVLLFGLEKLSLHLFALGLT